MLMTLIAEAQVVIADMRVSKLSVLPFLLVIVKATMTIIIQRQQMALQK